MHKTIYLIRHGEKERIMGDPALTDTGKLQAQQTADFLKAFAISRIISSPILRTKQTAEYIADALHLPLEIDSLLRERTNWGDDPNQSFDDFLTMWDKVSLDRDWQPPVGDSSIYCGKRLEKVIAAINDQRVVLVTHGGIISDYLRNVFPNLDAAVEEKIKECSITEIEITDNTPTAIKIGFIDHLS